VGDPAQIVAPQLTPPDGWDSFEGKRIAPTPVPQSSLCQVTFRQILRRTGPATKEVPPYQFTFFDPKTKTYQTVETPPLPLPFTTQPPTAAKAPAEAVASPAGLVLPPSARHAKSWVDHIPEKARWRGSLRFSQGVLVAVNLLGGSAVLTLLVLLMRHYFGKSSTAEIQRSRRTLRRQLTSITHTQNKNERIHQAEVWLEDWKHSPLHRPLKPDETEAVKSLHQRMAAALYAPDDAPPPPPDEIHKTLNALLS